MIGSYTSRTSVLPRHWRSSRPAPWQPGRRHRPYPIVVAGRGSRPPAAPARQRPCARPHARSGDLVALAACLGGSARFDQAIADFAEIYADQNERDCAALQAVVKDGKASGSAMVAALIRGRAWPAPRVRG